MRILLGLLSLLGACALAPAASADDYPRPTLDLGAPREEGRWSAHADPRSCVVLGPRWSGRLSARTSGDRIVALGRMPEGPGGGMGLLLFPTPLQLPPVAGGSAARVSLRAGWAAAEGEAVRLRGLGIFVRIQADGVEALLRGMAAGGHLEVVGPVGVSWDARGAAESAARTLRCLRG